MTEDPCNPLTVYVPSTAVQERMAAIKAARMTAAAKEAEVFRLAVEAGKIEWEVEILLGLEDGTDSKALLLPLETWPEHDMMENVRLWKNDPRLMKYDGIRVRSPVISWNRPGHKRYMHLFGAHFESEFIDINAVAYQQLVGNSTVLRDELNVAAALDAIQMGLPPDVIDILPWNEKVITPLIKERAKFRIALLRKGYPLLHEKALGSLKK